jgi:hypothetical protein
MVRVVFFGKEPLSGETWAASGNASVTNRRVRMTVVGFAVNSDANQLAPLNLGESSDQVFTLDLRHFQHDQPAVSSGSFNTRSA